MRCSCSLLLSRRSAAQAHPAGDPEGFAGDVRRLRRGEEGDRRGDLVGLAEAAQQGAGGHHLDGPGIHAAQQRRLDRAGGDGVHGDAVAGVLPGQCLGEGDDGALGGGIDGVGLAADPPRLRRQVDDPPVPRPLHGRQRRLGTGEDALEVHGQQSAPLVGGDVAEEHAGLINAGVDQPGVFFGDVTPDQWRRLLAVNLEGVFACTQAALPAMQRAGYGRIVNLSSEAGRIGGKANAVYSAAKGAVIAFTKALARENARYGITVNAVAPGPIETPLLRRMDPRAIEMVTASTLLRRLGEPDEVASAEASYVTGETLGVSGGMGLGG